MNKAQYLICVDQENMDRQFLAIDASSGGYPYWTTYQTSAEQMDEERATKWYKELIEKANAPQRPMSDGTLYPASEIHGALKLNNKHTKGSGELKLLKIETVEVRCVEISGEIKQPTGYTYASDNDPRDGNFVAKSTGKTHFAG